jgi:hypothetical protein
MMYLGVRSPADGVLILLTLIVTPQAGHNGHSWARHS